MNQSKQKMFRRLEIYCLVFIVLISFWVRIKNLFDWVSTPEMFSMYEGEPLPTNFDSYYYLSLTKDLVEDTYTPIDHNRAYPDGYARPYPPPLLSVLAAGLKKITPFSLNWIAVILPAVLGTLVVFPLYGLGRYYSGPLGGLLAAFFGSISGFYLYRSNLGWFDTDSMIVTFMLAICYFLLRFGVDKGNRKYIYLFGGIFSGLLLIWAWDSTPIAAAGIFSTTLSAALLFLFRPASIRESRMFSALSAAILLLILFCVGPSAIIQGLKHLIVLLKYITKQPESNFPNVGLLISEQAKIPIPSIAEITGGGVYGFFAAMFGLGYLFYKKRREASILFAPIALGFLSIFAKRFIIFLVPVCALGIGAFLAEAWRHRSYSRHLPILLFLVSAILLFPTFLIATIEQNWPVRSSWLIDGLNKMSKITPENSIIWTMPEGGYEINYWSRRATISDGSVHGGEHMVYNTIPFATDDLRFAANFIQFYAVRGIKGVHRFYEASGGDPSKGLTLIKKVLSVGPKEGQLILEDAGLGVKQDLINPDDWLEFLYPKETPPIYLLIDFRMLRIFQAIYWLGTWDIDKMTGASTLFDMYRNTSLAGEMMGSDYGFQANLETGAITDGKRNSFIKEARISTDEDLKSYDFDHEKGVYLDAYLPGNLAIVQYAKGYSSTMIKLFFSGQFEPSSYFDPVDRQMPAYQLFKVKADRITSD